MATVLGNDENNTVSPTHKDGGTSTFTTDGPDWVHMGNGDDDVFAGGGDDVIHGGFGSDRLLGGTGNDILIGGSGNDILYGENGEDFLSGGSGNDAIIGGRGRDELSGGTGADRFIFNARDSVIGNSDIINDFRWQEGDKIQFNHMPAETFVGYTNNPGIGEVGYYFDDGNTVIIYHAETRLLAHFPDFSTLEPTPIFEEVWLNRLQLTMIASDFIFFDEILI